MLARALILEPQFIVADEPVSMLDVSVRAGILNLMREVQETMGLTALYISHDLALVRYVCERTMVMYLGRVVEDGPTEESCASRAIPTRGRWSPPCRCPPRPAARAAADQGNVPDARNPPSGCRFRDRCPLAVPRCAEETPQLRSLADGQRVACHLE